MAFGALCALGPRAFAIGKPIAQVNITNIIYFGLGTRVLVVVAAFMFGSDDEKSELKSELKVSRADSVGSPSGGKLDSSIFKNGTRSSHCCSC